MRRCEEKMISVVVAVLVALSLVTLSEGRQAPKKDPYSPYLIPDPQFATLQGEDILVQNQAASLVIVLSADPSFKENLAQNIILDRLKELGGKADVIRVGKPADRLPDKAHVTVYLLNYRRYPHTKLEGLLDDTDRQVLEDRKHLDQNYVIRTKGRELFLVGSCDQGLLYAATTFIQLINRREDKIWITRAHIRDFPSFKYRVAADWLLNNEINRWAYDYGDGHEKYIERAKRKLDFCLLYKINGVRFEGFGWRLDRVPGYNAMIKELAVYARQRGIRLVHGGYGAGYALGTYQFFGGTRVGGAPSYEGKIFYNRRSYPSGATYTCIGHPFEDERHFGQLPPNFTRTLGTCRSNEMLNRLKADELKAYVRAVEPGGLYIHHEDVDNYRDTAPEWKSRRCESCRKRWPNDDLKAPDGGAGALAHGYNALLNAVFSVKNQETGYDARRDCFVSLISPAYMTYGTGESQLYSLKTVKEAHEDWNNLLQLWTNVSKQLKYQMPEVQIGFREIWPLENSQDNWVPAFQSRLDKQDLKIGIYFLVFQGADYTYNDYPFVTAPLTNVTFEGAATIENSSGSFAQEPMQLLNADYSWNVRAHGVFIPPTTHSETRKQYMRGAYNLDEPDEIVGEDGFLAQACTKIYGEQAGRSIYRFNRLYKTQREFTVEAATRVNETVPQWANERVYPIHTLAYLSSRASGTWRLDIVKTHQQLMRLAAAGGDTAAITGAILHEKLSKVWTLRDAVTQEGLEYVRAALQRVDLRPEAKEDLEYLSKRLNLGYRYAGTVSALHRAYRDGAAQDSAHAQQAVRQARERLGETLKYMNTHFEFRMVDPSGGDQSTWRYYTTLIGEKIDELEKSLTAR